MLAVVQESPRAQTTIDRHAQFGQVTVGTRRDEAGRTLDVVVPTYRREHDFRELLPIHRSDDVLNDRG